MNQAIDCGDVESYQKLSRVYDAMMKSAKFTEAQNKDKDGNNIDSASAIVDFVEAHSGEIPRYQCNQPKDIVDQIILDLKEYNKSLIYGDTSLAREIEKYLQDKRNSEDIKRSHQQAKANGTYTVELKDQDHIDYKDVISLMKEHDYNIDDQSIELQYQEGMVHQQ